jgi:hypothetical protein
MLDLSFSSRHHISHHNINPIMTPRLPLLVTSLLFWEAALMGSPASAATDESTYLTVYYNGYEGIQEDPANCNREGSIPCTTIVNDLPLYLDESLLVQTDGYTMDSVCVKRDETFYDCTFTVKTPTELISFEGPLNYSDSAPDVFDLTDHEGTATLVLAPGDNGLIGKIDIARVAEHSAAPVSANLSIFLLIASAFVVSSCFL